MNEELLKLAYQSLKRQFDNISKDSWIWTDFFEDEKVGFDYFKKQIEQDEDFACLQDETYYLDEDLDELAYDIAYEIALKLKENDFFHNRDVNAAINILKLGLNNISAGTVDYTDGEDRRPNLLKGHSSVKSEAHESLVRG